MVQSLGHGCSSWDALKQFYALSDMMSQTWCLKLHGPGFDRVFYASNTPPKPGIGTPLLCEGPHTINVVIEPSLLPYRTQAGLGGAARCHRRPQRCWSSDRSTPCAAKGAVHPIQAVQNIHPGHALMVLATLVPNLFQEHRTKSTIAMSQYRLQWRRYNRLFAFSCFQKGPL